MRKKLLWISFIIPLILSILNVNMIGVTIAQEQLAHDIAVTSVTLSLANLNITKVRLGELVNVTVVVENLGTENETFDVNVSYDTTPIDTKTVQNLTVGAEKSLTFTWNTTDVAAGTYSINATADVPNDEDTTNNAFVLPSIDVISPYIAVIPQRTVDPNLTEGTNYTVSIYTDYNGSDVWGFEFTLTYNPLVLEGVEVVNGSLITEDAGPTMWSAGTFDNDNGTLSLTSNGFFFFTPPAPTTSGPGILANVTFTVVGEGESSIILGKESRLEVISNPATGEIDNIIDDITDIAKDPTSGHFLHGFFQNKEVIHDIIITNVTPSQTSIEKGELVNITVVVENNGTVAEAVDVEVYYGYDPTIGPRRLIATKTINLENGTSTSLIFTWDTTSAETGTFPIIAVAELLGGVTDAYPDDNTRWSDDEVTIRAPVGIPIPILLIIGIAVVVVVIAVVVYALRRRKRTTPE